MESERVWKRGDRFYCNVGSGMALDREMAIVISDGNGRTPRMSRLITISSVSILSSGNRMDFEAQLVFSSILLVLRNYNHYPKRLFWFLQWMQ